MPVISTGDAGKVLAVNSGETGVEWITPASGGGSSDVVYIDRWTAEEVNQKLVPYFREGKAPIVVINSSGTYLPYNAEINSSGSWSIPYQYKNE